MPHHGTIPMRIRAAGFLLVFLLGCVPYSDNPLTDPDKATIDFSILGTWYWKEERESGYVHIGLDKESKLLRVIVVEFDKDGGLGVSEYSGHTSSMGDKAYLNIKEVRPPGEQQGYLFVKYRIQGERLGISIINNQAVVAAIKDGRLKGRIQESKWFSSPQITESQQALQPFILKNDKELFKDEARLHRLNLPHAPVQPTPDATTAPKR